MRKYEYETGRFTSIDPLWNKYYGWTPFQYSMNSPVEYNDGNGLLRIAAKNTRIYNDSPKQGDNLNLYSNFVYDLNYAIVPYMKATGMLERMQEIPSISKKQLMKDLEYGSGPEIYINQLSPLYDEFDAIQGDNKFELQLGPAQMAEDPNNWKTKSMLNRARAWRLVITIHGYLHDRFDLSHSQIYYILGGDEKKHPSADEVGRQVDEDIDSEEIFHSSPDNN